MASTTTLCGSEQKTICRLRVNGSVASREHTVDGRLTYRELLEWARERLDPPDTAIQFAATTYVDDVGDAITITADEDLHIAYVATAADRPLCLLVEVAAPDAVVRTESAALPLSPAPASGCGGDEIANGGGDSSVGT